jgi:hypothetical protein
MRAYGGVHSSGFWLALEFPVRLLDHRCRLYLTVAPAGAAARRLYSRDSQ